MDICSTYSVKIKDYNNIFKESIYLYRKSVDFFIDVCLKEWDSIEPVANKKDASVNVLEKLTIPTGKRPNVKYNFNKKFYKMPSYLRRAAIKEAVGQVSSYKSNLKKWKSQDIKTRGKEPSRPKAGFCYPCLYRGNMFNFLDTYKAEIKVFRNNTWDWLEVDLKKSDIDYIKRRYNSKNMKVPKLQKRGKQWFLDFPFKETVDLNKTDISNQTIVAVDLGINSAATLTVMTSDGTILDRCFLKLSKEYDSLNHSVNRIKKAQQNRNYKTPRLWAKVKGLTHDISVKTTNFIIDKATLYNADTIVFEHLDVKKKKSHNQKIHLWKCQDVQKMVTHKAHKLSIRISHICARNTSKLAFDGSGFVVRGSEAGFKSYSICRFQNGKVYNCDLSAAYNIGARYFIREILKSLPEKVRLVIEAKVPQCTKRSTCTFSTLISLNAELKMLAS